MSGNLKYQFKQSEIMSTKTYLIIGVIVVVGVIAAGIISKRFGLDAYEIAE